ncbi:MAG: hypothetical protein AUK47_14385 [Deltaproteobacteria bacterium CG2_30_63_29]|nr:MAG: hypothetical protein AUK47_14385 [Deltaproteobacteria bacterium CG2_30_63_29]PJB37051.1 MAG: hypothetical protein CO108_21910 [Deltaproteobacteria bacterium CG_4_9_14_3_um_filter_63_12]
MMRLVTLLFVLLAALSFVACDDGGGVVGGDCTSLCTEAQVGDCTAIKGNCGNFCAALDAKQGAAGCTDLRTAYISCLNQGANVCDINCDTQENALSSCMGNYCAQNLSDPDCQTLIGSFQ